jgi:heme o synthase
MRAEIELASSAPISAAGAADYLELTKPRITFLVLVTTAVGYLMGASAVDLWQLVVVLAGTALVSGGACALNQVWERESDGRMRRTEKRPLPAGRMSLAEAIWFSSGISVAGLLVLTLGVNLLAGAVAAMTLAMYIFLYTPAKKRTSLATVIGAIPGALPPVIGWAAARGAMGSGAWVLFAIMFFWQLPHFLAISWIYREDYARAGFPLLAVEDPVGHSTGRQMVLYSLALVPVALAPTILHLTGLFYFGCALALSLAFLAVSVGFALERSAGAARRVFFLSIVYLPVLLALMVGSRLGPS